MKQKAKEIVGNLISIIGKENTLAIRYFEILRMAIDIDLERIHNTPKINIIKCIVETYDNSLSANDMFLRWYDVNHPIRNLVELDSDKILSGVTDIR